MRHHYQKNPSKRELGIIPAQRKLLLYSVICMVLSFLCAYLESEGIPIKIIAIIMCILTCITTAIYIITVFDDGFMATGEYVIRGGFYLFLHLFRLLLALAIVIMMTAIVYQ